ncbi:prephenate dehydrogenase [Dendrothele bispora CBS 962.96]|uniref:Prephenate dehydrogenase n=1 Tax=Dendrothele bispora (strain CBS 962.96) TaxID=1314807 RepID=A0A4S8M275_DENBC|nr:prephenate dehydrogenase [Dendrothele bispora CBS 962.96]
MQFSSSLAPNDPSEQQPTIGIIGMGAMGRMYANHLAKAGWKKIHVCDQPSKYEELLADYSNFPGVKVFPDGHAVARSADFMMFSVEAEFIESVVAEYGPSTKINAIVAGQTSVKAPEKEAFEKYLPSDVHIVSCHSLHGPTVSPLGQPLVLINHRGTEEALLLVENIFRSFGSRYVYLSYEEHDLVTANTQAVTHAAFLSMGTAWASSKSYPWEHGLYVGGIETVKVNLTLRIYSNAWHVYAGLAILNPIAQKQINQYATSTTELFKLMLEAGTAKQNAANDDQECERKLRQRVEWAREVVFGGMNKSREPILLSEAVLDKFSLGQIPAANEPANLHVYRVAQYLFLTPTLLDIAIHSAIHDIWHRSDDLEFVIAARGWSQCVKFGSFEVYRRRFEETRSFFESRFEEAGLLGSEMIKAVMASEMK